MGTTQLPFLKSTFFLSLLKIFFSIAFFLPLTENLYLLLILWILELLKQHAKPFFPLSMGELVVVSHIFFMVRQDVLLF